MRRVAAFVLLLGCAAFASGCRSGGAGGSPIPLLAPVPPGTGGGGGAGLSAAEIVTARKLAALKCARCHKFYDPTNYSHAEWRSWMTKMSRKARLKPEQDELLSRFLEVVRTAPRERER